MTGKELAEHLLKLDPDGTIPVCCENREVYFPMLLEAYYDGRIQRHIRDPEKIDKCYSIIGGKICERGSKIELATVGVYEILENDPDAPIDLSEISGQHLEMWKKKIKEYRRTITEVINKCDEEWIEEGGAVRNEDGSLTRLSDGTIFTRPWYNEWKKRAINKTTDQQ